MRQTDQAVDVRSDYSYEELSCFRSQIPEYDQVTRKRFQVAALSVKGLIIKDIAKITDYSEQTVIKTIDDYNQFGIRALFDGRRRYHLVSHKLPSSSPQYLPSRSIKQGTSSQKTKSQYASKATFPKNESHGLTGFFGFLIIFTLLSTFNSCGASNQTAVPQQQDYFQQLPYSSTP